MTTDHKQAAKSPGNLQHAQSEAEPRLKAKGVIIQTPGQVRHMPIGLSAEVRYETATTLNQVLVDTLMLYHLYKKAHWQVAGHTFYQLHLLFDKHAGEQLELVDLIAERVQLLGGIATGMPHDIVEQTNIQQAPQGAEEIPLVIDRLLQAHERILMECRGLAREAEDRGDFGTNDLLVSNVIRTNELQVWFVAEHVVETPSV
ncbi:MAG TPA: DNA starvation/stationary phase protection protein [Ktedonobacterales bacterium]